MAGTDDFNGFIAVSASAVADQKLTTKRLAWLADHLNLKALEAVSLGPKPKENTMRLFLMKQVGAFGRPAAPNQPAPAALPSG